MRPGAGGRPGLAGPVTPVLDNARCQRNAVVQDLAQGLGIELLFRPSYSPNLNLIERLWRFARQRAVYGRYHPTSAEFRAAVQGVRDRASTTHADKLGSLMTVNFQEFEDGLTPGRVKYKYPRQTGN